MCRSLHQICARMSISPSRGEAMSDLLWHVWWTGSRGVLKSVAGEFARHREAMDCITQLSQKHPNASFSIEYIGKSLGHHQEGRTTSKH